jgi:hypothetical protein
VFLALNIEADPVCDRVRAWREIDHESIRLQSLSAELAIESLTLPPPARLVSYAASTSPVAPLKMQISYLTSASSIKPAHA